jgi:hypothetical protein
VCVHFDSLSTPRVEVVGDNHGLTVLDELERLDHHALEGLEERVPEAPRRRLAPVDACLKAIRTRPIDHEIGIGQSIEGIEVEDAKISTFCDTAYSRSWARRSAPARAALISVYIVIRTSKPSTHVLPAA